MREFIGVYDADGTLVGEVRYWIRARLGRTHCGLCEITHGLFTERADWRQCRDQLDVEFHTYHRNDAPADVLAAFPCCTLSFFYLCTTVGWHRVRAPDH